MSKIAKFLEFKFREFHFTKKIYESNFRDFWKSSFLDGNNFHELLEKVNNNPFKSHFFSSIEK